MSVVMGIRILLIEKTNLEFDTAETIEVFVDILGFNAEKRANEVIDRLRAQEQNDEVEYLLKESFGNRTDMEIGLEPTLEQFGNVDEFVRLAYLELKANEKMRASAWIDPSWLQAQLKARYNVLTEIRNRELRVIECELQYIGCSSASNFTEHPAGLYPAVSEAQLAAVENGDADEAGFIETP